MYCIPTVVIIVEVLIPTAIVVVVVSSSRPWHCSSGYTFNFLFFGGGGVPLHTSNSIELLNHSEYHIMPQKILLQH